MHARASCHASRVTPSQLVDLLQNLNSLSELPRTGWVLRGVANPETIAAHSYGVAVVAMCVVDALREAGESVDGERVLRMALLHDAAEAATGDVPMPVKSPELQHALKTAETVIAERILGEYAKLFVEAEQGETLEARIVKASDKIQMMIKLLCYTQQGRGQLDEFWTNPKNRRHANLAFAKTVYEEIQRRHEE